jgi:hypothetical protein
LIPNGGPEKGRRFLLSDGIVTGGMACLDESIVGHSEVPSIGIFS